MKICSAVLFATGCRCEFAACTVTLIVFAMQSSCSSMWEWKALIFVELNDLYKFYFWIALQTWNCHIIKKAIRMSFQSFIFWLWCICHWGFHRIFSFPDGFVYISKFAMVWSLGLNCRSHLTRGHLENEKFLAPLWLALLNNCCSSWILLYRCW